jgi:hypothetical protein
VHPFTAYALLLLLLPLPLLLLLLLLLLLTHPTWVPQHKPQVHRSHVSRHMHFKRPDVLLLIVVQVAAHGTCGKQASNAAAAAAAAAESISST